MQNVIIPQTMEQRVSWKTTLDAIVVTAGMINNFTVQLRPVVTDASPTEVSAAYYRFNVRPFYKEEKVILSNAHALPVPEHAKELAFSLKIPEQMRRGYYTFQLILEDAEHTPIGNYTTFLVVNDAIDPLKDNPYMSLESVRTELGDISFEDNHLLDSQEVGTWDIAAAVKRAVEQWNNTAPRISFYSGETFPYPEILRRGVIFMLLQSLVLMLERNRMSYAAGNTTVDLERRVDAYTRLREEYRTLWRGGVEQAKNEENIEQFNQTLVYQ